MWLLKDDSFRTVRFFVISRIISTIWQEIQGKCGKVYDGR
ncbi:hypothetical protein DSBG_3663 [Desulfosporosinus sp. BG]|nr:hypothetical protein DSBG_3663 [Desulfosporosinus sp. BG]